MFRIKIIYFVNGVKNRGDSEREAVVMAENLQRAEEKVKKMDPAYGGICSVTAREFPNKKCSK